ncbi:MAG: hypothetical protein KDI30_00900 [Pseudomonadales bacterium]|nr:hypothetical protein [Pseudomonadales bacterium]
MRWIFLFLVVSNCGLLLWHMLEESRVERIQKMNQLSGVEAVMPGERIRLFSEGRDDADLSVQSVSGESKNDGVCYLLGPVDDQDVRITLAKYLERANVGFGVREVKINQRIDFAVYLKPQPKRETAQELLEKLKAKGVDSFIIPGGELANGLSLGVFSEKKNAIAQMHYVSSLGFDANINESEKYDLEPWFVLDALNVEMSDIFWQKLKQEFPSIKKSQGFCQ